MPKSTLKFIFINTFFFKKYYKNKLYFSKKLKYTFFRPSTIPIFLVNKVFYVHFGFAFRPILIKSPLIGFKFGEFTLTKKPFKQPTIKKKKR